MSDNFHIDVSSECRASFDKCMELLWHKVPGGFASHYTVRKIEGVETLILLWHEEQDAKPLPFKLSLEAAKSFGWNWLEQSAYGGQPDHDGDNGRGFRVFNEDWGHVSGMHYAFAGIQPCWMMYGK